MGEGCAACSESSLGGVSFLGCAPICLVAFECESRPRSRRRRAPGHASTRLMIFIKGLRPTPSAVTEKGSCLFGAPGCRRSEGLLTRLEIIFTELF